MANIALTTADKIEVVESREQHTAPAAEAITAGAPVRFDTSLGTFTPANGTTAAEARVYGIATKTVGAGQALTAIRQGVLDGFVLTGVAYDGALYLSDTDGRIADAAGTVPIVLGRVITGHAQTLGVAPDKLVLVDLSNADSAYSDSATLAGNRIITSELLAASVDKWLFVADRAYTVVGVREIHSVAGGSVAAVKVRTTTAAATSAPAATASSSVLELLANPIDLTATANISQSPALVGTAATVAVAIGDKISLLFSGTLTGLVGLVEVLLKPV